jgi:hypothetical protein
LKKLTWHSNTFSMEFKGFEPLVSGPNKLPNCAYSLHDYSNMGFPSGDPFIGSEEQKARLERTFLRKAEFMAQHGVAAWNGEFGPVYSVHEPDPVKAQAIDTQRYNLLGEQLRIYDKYQISWSIWLYKDIGLQGMIHTAPDSKWMRTIAPFLKIKLEAQLDAWGAYPSAPMKAVLDPFVRHIESINPDAGNEYPTNWGVERQITRAVLQVFLSRTLQGKFAEQFRGMGKEELEECARSFSFKECKKREGLNEILREHAKLRTA